MMNFSNQILYQEITDKLKTAPKEVLERISAYLSEISKNKEHLNFELSTEQKESLSKIKRTTLFSTYRCQYFSERN